MTDQVCPKVTASYLERAFASSSTQWCTKCPTDAWANAIPMRGSGPLRDIVGHVAATTQLPVLLGSKGPARRSLQAPTHLSVPTPGDGDNLFVQQSECMATLIGLCAEECSSRQRP
ncbi:MAG: hypothetical protein ACJZ6C_05795 [Candidatus Poriferisodalaceae bacterium]